MARRIGDSPATKATLLLASALTVLSSMTLSPDLPRIRAYFRNAPGAETLVPLMLTLHALFIVLGSPLAGFVVDRFGRKRLLIAAATLYGVAGSAGFVLDGLGPLLASRALLGLATAGTMTAATTLIADYYTGQTRAKFAGWQAAAMNFGGVAALAISGPLADRDWRLPFLIYLVGLALVPLIATTIVEPQRGEPVVSSSEVDGHRDHVPVRTLSLIYATMAACMLLFFFLVVRVPFHLAALVDATSTQIAVALAAANFCTGITALLYPRLREAIPDRAPLIALGFAGLGVGLVIVGIAPTYSLVVVGMFLAGTVQGIFLPTLNLWTAAVTPVAARGRAVSGLTASIFIGQFVSPFVSGPLTGMTGIATAFLLAGGIAFALAAVAMVAGWRTGHRSEVLSETNAQPAAPRV